LRRHSKFYRKRFKADVETGKEPRELLKQLEASIKTSTRCNNEGYKMKTSGKPTPTVLAQTSLFPAPMFTTLVASRGPLPLANRDKEATE